MASSHPPDSALSCSISEPWDNMNGNPDLRIRAVCFFWVGREIALPRTAVTRVHRPRISAHPPLDSHILTRPSSKAIAVRLLPSTQKSNAVPRMPIVAFGVSIEYTPLSLFPEMNRKLPPSALTAKFRARLLPRIIEASTIILAFGPTAIFVSSLNIN